MPKTKLEKLRGYKVGSVIWFAALHKSIEQIGNNFTQNRSEAKFLSQPFDIC